MATIKSYSDLQQSKKLAEILPLESADMHYCLENRDVATGYEIGITPFIKAKRFEGKCNIVNVQPAWSLAALLGVLPDAINGTYCRLIIDKEGDVYNISYDDIFSKESVILYAEYSLIDACYEMILKLHELKML